jgi:D-3-phosphoglycerate dehydrogenase
MLAFARNLFTMTEAMRAGKWEKINGRALRECTLGVVGAGNVGKAVIRRANAFGMQIIATDPVSPPYDFLMEHNVAIVARDVLLQRSDFVSLNCDLNPTSHHLMNDGTFALMKPQAVLINAARGAIVDEAALIRALQSGNIAGAALDVFEHEPLSAESPLREMHNVLLAPHNSNSSPEAWERVHHNTINNLLDVLEKSEPYMSQ